MLADLDISQLLDLGPLGIAGGALWLFAKFVAAFTRIESDVRAYVGELRDGLVESARQRELEREHWTALLEHAEAEAERGAQVIELLARAPAGGTRAKA